jgi:hypothetical protein
MLMFGAPAADIGFWSGIPQKRRFGNDETIGFQRDESPKRVESLREFFADDENIIQNPLLCASRVLDGQSIRFDADSDNPSSGTVTITAPDVNSMSFQDILARVRTYLESRVPELSGQAPKESLVIALKERARQEGHLGTEEEESPEDLNGHTDAEESGEDSEVEDVTSVLFEESHIADFWEEIAARHEVAKLVSEPIQASSFLGFAREGLVAYILPVVLVDGQHRLRGALAAALVRLQTDEIRAEIEKRLDCGEDAVQLETDLLCRESRRLPVSLLLSAEPAEQVFQFVVVNQKAIPVGRALLGTIVSTTLSNDEMAKVATRLKNAGIRLEESQAITYLARHPDSPFLNRVERGLAGSGAEQDLLQWNVFASLVSIFRYLREGKLFGEKNDYAHVWRTRFLNESPIVADFGNKGCADAFECWSRADGPWREIFIKFFSEVRSFFGETTVPELKNYWGRPRDSNLFNKISLTILSADFFQYLVETKSTLSSANDISTLFSEWLEGVNPEYFSRDWNLGGVKKDSTGIRNQWASLWSQYRKNPEMLPQARSYRIPKVV